MEKTTPAIKEDSNRKPLPYASCIFADEWWNDSEQCNYHLHKCNNPENTGGKSNFILGKIYDKNEYSCHHKNEEMKYRCWGMSEKIAECSMALSQTQPEVDCEMFTEEEASPSIALVSKEELKEKFYQPNGLCLSCQNCLEDSL